MTDGEMDNGGVGVMSRSRRVRPPTASEQLQNAGAQRTSRDVDLVMG